MNLTLCSTPAAPAVVALALALSSCTVQVDDPAALGALELALTTQAGGVAYRLTDARFALAGPESRGFASGSEDRLNIEVLPGAYTLELLAGWSLVRADMPEAPAVSARLVSENPAPVLIEAGQTTELTLHFELGPSPQVQATGTLSLGFDVAGTPADAGASAEPCSAGLRIDEVDYEQASTDEAEFVEIVNTAPCPAPLAAVALELVNGSDGRVYARYDLGPVAEVLAAGQRLVVGDPALLANVPEGALTLPLTASGMQNGPDGVRLSHGDQLIDGFAYEGPVSGVSDSSPGANDEGEGSFGRCPDGFDSDQNALDFQLLPPTPGSPNACP